MSVSDFSLSAIIRNLGTRYIGQKIFYYPRLTSTMTFAREKARQRVAEGSVVIAGEQTAGRGRLNRFWLTPGGNIALSIILYPDKSYLPYLVMVSSLAVARSIEMVTGLITQIKWPNDVLINGKKVCGVLAESQMRGEEVAYAVAGIGINVRLNPDDFPEIAKTATSLMAELGKDVSRVELVRCLLAEFEKYYLSLANADTVYQEWRDRLVTLGERVWVESGRDVLEGIAESVAKDGSLLLRGSDGALHKIIAGDVTLSGGQ